MNAPIDFIKMAYRGVPDGDGQGYATTTTAFVEALGKRKVVRVRYEYAQKRYRVSCGDARWDDVVVSIFVPRDEWERIVVENEKENEVQGSIFSQMKKGWENPDHPFYGKTYGEMEKAAKKEYAKRGFKGSRIREFEVVSES